MRINLIVGLIAVLLLAGCATVQNNQDAEIARLTTQVQALESELKLKQDENVSLKERVAELEKTAPRLPTGKDIQTSLKNAGFYQGEIDGEIGPQTKEAIKKFQEANGLNPDGVMGSKTWAMLSKYLEAKSE